MVDAIGDIPKKKLKKNISNDYDRSMELQDIGFDYEFTKKKKKKRKHDNINQEISDNDNLNYCNLTDIDLDISVVNSNINDTTCTIIEKDKNKKKHHKTLSECNLKVITKDDSLNISDNAIKKKKHKNKRKLMDIDHSDIATEENVNNHNNNTITDKEDNNYSHISVKKKKEKNFLVNSEVNYVNAKHHKLDLENPVKKKKKRVITEELKLPTEECEEKYKNSKGNENLIQRPSYFSSKSITNEEWEHKRTWYPDLKEDVVTPNEGRAYTISIALPASILEDTCLTQVLKTYVIGQLARAACIYSIDEIVVFNDQCWRNNGSNCDRYIGMMKMILEYTECPQYLRKHLFPKHHYLQDVGILNALNAPHHLLAYQWCDYREGVVCPKLSGKYSSVHIGLKYDIQIDRKVEPGLRVTVHLPPEAKAMKKLYGHVVSPEEPRTKVGMYWGYTVRVAHSLSEVFKSDRFSDGYDLIIGTSDKGSDARNTSFQKFNHALIIFGGVHGLETAHNADEDLSGSKFSELFHHYVNVCPNQTSRTIRTEEAVLITLATLCPKLTIKGLTKPR